MKLLDDIDIQDKINLLIRAGFVVRLEKIRVDAFGKEAGPDSAYPPKEIEMYRVHYEGNELIPYYISSTGYHNKYELINYAFTKLTNKLLVESLSYLIDNSKISPLDIFD